MQLSKLVPARRKTITFNWCAEFVPMCEKYRSARSGMKNKMDHCFWCNHGFIDGEMMAIAQTSEGRNKVLCATCADELLATKEG